MANPAPVAQDFTIAAVIQSGRLQYEAVLLAASIRTMAPGFSGRLVLMEPQPGPLWGEDPRVTDPAVRGLLADLGAEIRPFDTKVWGTRYPHGNKIEGLAVLDDGPFLFLDTDTLVTGDIGAVPFDFSRPSASMRREGTWPIPDLYGPQYDDIWGALYRRFGLDFASSLDLSQPDEHWRRYLYFNAGWFFHRSARSFAKLFLAIAREIEVNRPPELVCQELYPWLDQIALPLVIHSLGGGRPGPDLAGLDGDVTCHWRVLPLFYARESDLAVEVMERVAAPREIRRVLKDHLPFKKMIYQGMGQQARALFDRAALPRKEQVLRNTLKREGLWLR